MWVILEKFQCFYTKNTEGGNIFLMKVLLLNRAGITFKLLIIRFFYFKIP